VLTVCFTAKGGQGCSVVTALLALLHPPTTVIDVGGDIPALLGLGEATGPGLVDLLADDDAVTLDAVLRATIEAVPGIDLVHRGTTPAHHVPEHRWEQLAEVLVASPSTQWLVDAGTTHGPLVEYADHRVLVTRPCYLALRRARALTYRPTSVIVVREPGRVLGKDDVEHVVQAPVRAELDVDVAIARGVDAGLLASQRVPGPAARALRDA